MPMEARAARSWSVIALQQPEHPRATHEQQRSHGPSNRHCTEQQKQQRPGPRRSGVLQGAREAPTPQRTRRS